ncbi:hypothetical protein O6H91_Y287200 [Diphasiastrum complanatum]|nr:hypothetical protein O6H91_Y287200 [Diphasiastrum complanatum]
MCTNLLASTKLTSSFHFLRSPFLSPFFSSDAAATVAITRSVASITRSVQMEGGAVQEMPSTTRKRVSSPVNCVLASPLSHSKRWVAAGMKSSNKEDNPGISCTNVHKSRRSLFKEIHKLQSSSDDQQTIIAQGLPSAAFVEPPSSFAQASLKWSFKTLSKDGSQSGKRIKKSDRSKNTIKNLDHGGGVQWKSLGVSSVELCLSLTLLTGQSFRWRQTGPAQFTGVLESHLLSLRQTKEDILFYLHNSLSFNEDGRICEAVDVAEVLHDYFHLGTSLVSLWETFSAADERFAEVAPYMTGARLLRQKPLECVFQFICSSNNHIQRISQMVEYLSSLGPFLGTIDGHHFHAFPSLDELASVTEKQLRDAGFGYRAKYIVGTIQALRMKDGGGIKWLHALKNTPLEQTTEALCTLPGIGPKVAACIALFSLDKHQAIPVDTHVWQIAVRYLTPELAGERLTPKLHAAVSGAFVRKFGEYAGWAQTVLFISELSAYQNLLPQHLQSTKVKSTDRKE